MLPHRSNGVKVCCQGVPQFGGWPTLVHSLFVSFPISERGRPILAFFARVGRDAADSIMLVCLAACIDTTAPITCTLSRVLVIAACLFCAPPGAATDYSPC